MKRLFWKFSQTHGFQVVFAKHPTLGDIFMGVTMDEARKAACECDWIQTAQP